MDIDALRADYEAHLDALHGLCTEVTSWLQGLMSDLGVKDAGLDARVKDTSSLLLKAVRKTMAGRWQDPLVDASDLVGLRTELVFVDDVENLVGAIVSSSAVELLREPDNKLEGLGAKQLGYQGTHLDVRWAAPLGELPDHLREVEIQVRSQVQGAWATAEHDLVYKTPVDVPIRLQRKINRLTALLECYDETLGQVRTELIGQDGYGLAIVIDALESARLRFLAAPHDRELTRVIVATVMDPDIEAPAARRFADELTAFVEANRDAIAHLIGQEGPALLMRQPEVLLLFMELDRRKMRLSNRWDEATLPRRLLEDLADAWGEPLPQPS